LGEEETSAEENENTIVVWQAAEALRIRDWAKTGMDGGAAPLDRIASEEPSPVPHTLARAVRTRNNGIGIIYGLRTIDRQDSYSVSAVGGIIETFYLDTVAENHIIGPQVGLVWLKTRGRWSARLQGMASMGFNYGDVQQDGQIGPELIPGALNRPLFARPTEFAHKDPHNEFSPNGELRAEAIYRITNRITFAVDWSGVVIDNALESQERVRLALPDMGLIDRANQRTFVHNFFCGIEMVR
jgi:hypothetical protein